MEEINVKFILELHRFEKTVAGLLSVLPLEYQKKYRGQISWFIQQSDQFMAANKVSIIYPDLGSAYDVGSALNPVNLPEFDKDAELVIDQVLDPIIMHDGKVIQQGTVILKNKAE